ncbi:conserved hypothetical protein [Culex quinquefasciatus]|uniref:FP protein C-terminal domain-containing protein n=1 Tax=Culex quinquefasciatus TaxID=7176 RepID=B0X2N0_CULQU|nr:conserved hypothetical protein [Culex quinquefasciatus]|eukprot:XP_001863902.1 conserved hypothetical protein [Culex quinquefasciatus]
MKNSAFLCATCNTEENDQNKIVLCHYCMKCEHLSCKKVYGVAAEKLRAKKYFCSLDCAKLSSHTSSGMENQIMEEIGKVLAEDTIGELQRTHNSFAEKVDTLLNEMQAIKEDQQLLKNDVAVLQEEQFAVNETITDLEKQLDQLNRAALATHAVILGVPSSKDEDLKKVITDITLAVKCTLPEDAIVETKRLVSKDGEQTGKPVPIKKKCHGLLLSSTIGSNNTGTGGSRIILRDELTSFGMTLLKQARVVQEAADLKFVWPGRDGVILVRATDNSKVEKIRNAKDLQKLQHQHPKRLLDGSLLNSTMLSLNGAPAPKQQKQL